MNCIADNDAKDFVYEDIVGQKVAEICDLILSVPENERPCLSLNAASFMLDFCGHVVSRSDLSHLNTRLFLMSAEAEQMARWNNVVWMPWSLSAVSVKK